MVPLGTMAVVLAHCPGVPWTLSSWLVIPLILVGFSFRTLPLVLTLTMRTRRTSHRKGMILSSMVAFSLASSASPTASATEETMPATLQPGSSSNTATTYSAWKPADLSR